MKKNFLVLLLAVFCITAWSQETQKVSKDEEKALSYAKRAFQDKLYDDARHRFEEFLKNYPKSASKNEVNLLLGQSLYFQEKYNDALQKFCATPKEKRSPEFIFWEAETLTALQRWPEAREVYQKFIDAYPQNENVPAAKLGLANLFFQDFKKDEALALLQELQAIGLKESVGQRAILLKSKILLAQDQTTQAKELLDQLYKQNLNPPILFEVLYWLAEIQLKEKKIEQALKLYHRITDDQRASPKELVALAWFGIGEVFKEQKKWEAAAEAFSKAYSSAKDSKNMQVAMQRFLGCHRENKSLTTGALQLREFAKKNEDPIALYSIAKTFYESGNTDAAISELDNLLQAYPKSDWASEAYLLMGTILTQTDQAEAAIHAFKKLIEQNHDPARTREAQFHLAELYFKSQKFSEAAAIYQQISKSSQIDLTLEQMLYNATLAFSHARQKDEFLKTEEILRKTFPKSSLLRNVVLEKARLFNELGDGKQSREILSEFIEKNPQSPLLPQALFMMGSSFYRDVDYAAAAQKFYRIEAEFPTSELFVKASYHRIESEWRAGKTTLDRAREQYSRLLESHPNDEMAPIIAFQIAQTYYEQQNFGDAEKAFQKFTETYPKSDLYNDALYYAGRSLMWLTNYEGAIATFEKIHNDLPLKTDARLAEIDCYRLLGKFEAALKIANFLIPEDAKVEMGPAQAEAMLRKANILFTMATDNSKLYEQALQSAELVLKTDSSNVSQRNEAGFIKGKSLEKLNRSDEALQSYLDIVYGKLLPQFAISNQPEYRWFTRCGVEAAQMKENQKDVKGAIAIYRILERLSGPNREEFSKKIEDLRTRYFIWED